MKKSLLVMFVVILAIALAFVWVWAKDSVNPTAKQTTVSQPTLQGQKKIVSPPAKAKGLTVDKSEAIEKQALPTREKPLDYCEVAMLDVYEQFGSTYSLASAWIAPAYGFPDMLVTLIDPNAPYYGPCTQPTFPFNVTDVSLLFRRYTATTSGWMHGVIYEAVPDPGDPTCLVPGAELARTGDYYDSGPAGGRIYIYALPLLTPVCVYGKFFAGWVVDSMPGVSDPSAGYTFRFSGAGTTCNDYEDYGTGFYDVGAIGYGGICMWAGGNVRSQNSCPADTVWFFKKSYVDAPCGVPDFDQYDHGFPNNGDAYCGPTAMTNCFYWMWAAGNIPKIWTGEWDEFADQLAASAGTDPLKGTDCDALEQAVSTLIKNTPLWLTERTLYGPNISFDQLEVELRQSQDIILLLGFWYEQTPGVWKRFGGHFVTVTGCNQALRAFAFSDPAFDNAELGQPGVVCGIHPPHPGDPLMHDNPGFASRDFFPVTPGSPSPGGVEGLPTYWYGRETEMAKFAGQNFRAIHLPNEGPVPPPGTPVFTEIEQAIIICPASPVEYGKVKSSKAQQDNSNRGEIGNGSTTIGFGVDFGTGIEHKLYDGSFFLGNTDTTMCFAYGYPDYQSYDESFIIQQHVSVDSFNVAGAAGNYKVQQFTVPFKHRYEDLSVKMYAFGFTVPVGGTEDCEYVVEDVYVVTNTGAVPVNGLVSGMFLDYDVGTYDSVMFDQQHQSVWQYSNTVPEKNYGVTMKPAVVGQIAVTGWGLANYQRIYPPGTSNYGGAIYDSLFYWCGNGLGNLGWGKDPAYAASNGTDRSSLIGGTPFDLAPGAIHIEKFLKWGYGAAIAQGGDAAWRHFLYNVLHQEGFYRGDVNKDGKLSAADVIYLVNFMYKSGPKPKEFTDQGDINNTGNVNAADLIYLINYLYKSGPAPIDKNRFLADPNNFVDPAHRVLGVRNPGLFGDNAWKGLGQ